MAAIAVHPARLASTFRPRAAARPRSCQHATNPPPTQNGSPPTTPAVEEMYPALAGGGSVSHPTLSGWSP
eukprot:1182436-Prorocentrum_minimum.AAC.2